ncbi:MAG: hypothetical protein LBB94_04505 [Clostridiales bacterium]|jgi:hypothetical protein|nr:hypothetical protein [Clostridiales bacterium]
MLSKRKIFAATTSLSLCALLIAGTFAWSSFNSSIINTWTGDGQSPEPGTGPGDGGTLHDDHCADDPNKDVYVENWGESPLFVRIKLSEYMEVGEGAGIKRNPDENHAVSIVDGASIDDYSSWTPHASSLDDEDPSKPSGDLFHQYWNWTMGGGKHYFPVSEKERRNTDSNGMTYVDSGTPEFLHPLNVNADGKHAKETLEAAVVTMSQWIAMGSPVGNYWVLDTDGFAYWAAPLLPGDATGLLVNKVESIKEPADYYYYGIYVDAQMATKDGVAGDNYEVFFNDATAEGGQLLNKIVDAPVSRVNIVVNKAVIGDYIYAEPGDEVILHAFSDGGSTGVVWSSVESEGFRFSSNGNEAVIIIADNAPKGSKIILTAAYGGVSLSRTLEVMPYSTEITISGRTFIYNEDNTYTETADGQYVGYTYSAGPDLTPGTADDYYSLVEVNGVRYITTNRVGWFRNSGPDGKLGTADDEEEYLCLGTPPVTPSYPTNTPTRPPDWPTSTPTPTRTPDWPTNTPTPTRTPDWPTSTPTPTRTPDWPTSTPTPTRTPDWPTSTPTPTRTPTPTSTPRPTPPILIIPTCTPPA